MKRIIIHVEKSKIAEFDTKSEAVRYDSLVYKRVVKKVRERFTKHHVRYRSSSTTSVIVEPDDRFIQQEVYAIIKEAFTFIYAQRHWTDAYAASRKDDTIWTDDMFTDLF